MIYKVSAGELSKLRFNETDIVQSILQNIAVILSTPKGTVPMHRDFGLDMEFLDRPTAQAEVLMIAPVREAVETWEPRAKVKGITFLYEKTRPERPIPCVEAEILS